MNKGFLVAFVFSCPLGYEADINDMRRLDPDFADTLSVGD